MYISIIYVKLCSDWRVNMAGRSYNVPVKVPSSRSEEPKEKPKKSFLEHLMYDDLDAEFEEAERQTGQIFTVQMCLAIITVVAFITSVLVYFVATVRYDYQNGADTSPELVTDMAQWLSPLDYENIKPYLPRILREEGFVPDSDEFAAFREDYAGYRYQQDSLVIVNDEVFTDTAQLEQGLLSVYGKTETIREARLVQVKLRMINGKDTNDFVDVMVNMIPIKILHKWYIYTGAPVSYQEEPVVFLTVCDKAESAGEQVADISYVEKQPEPVPDETDALPLDFYEGALSDLLSGKFVMNGTEYALPDLFSAFSGVFTLDKEALPASQSLTLSPDAILGNLPLRITDEAFDGKLYVSVANLSRESVLIQDASVTTLCISAKDPVVLLPGNVTFGTSFPDVAKMYGDLLPVADTQFKGTLSDGVYAIPLENERNKIYLGFTDGKLVEVQWFYIDVTDYREL